MSHLPLLLSYLFPMAMYVHAVARVFSAGARQSKALVLVPAMSIIFATLWLGTSLSAQMNGGMREDVASAQLTVGPFLLAFFIAAIEVPFALRWLHSRGGRKPTSKT